jgi:hypothetical protein
VCAQLFTPFNAAQERSEIRAENASVTITVVYTHSVRRRRGGLRRRRPFPPLASVWRDCTSGDLGALEEELRNPGFEGTGLLALPGARLIFCQNKSTRVRVLGLVRACLETAQLFACPLDLQVYGVFENRLLFFGLYSNSPVSALGRADTFDISICSKLAYSSLDRTD